MEMQRGENPFNDPVSRLKSVDANELAGRAGCEWSGSGEGAGELTVPVLGERFTVTWPEITIEAPESLDSFSLKLLCLLYLTGTDGTAPSGEWIAYRELPNARFYEPVVKRSVEEPLAASSPLWTMPHVIVTPHTAGETCRYEDGVIDLLVENVSRLQRGETTLANQIV